MEFRCFQPVEEIRQRPSSNGTARTSEEEHFELHHRTKCLQHLRCAGRRILQHLQQRRTVRGQRRQLSIYVGPRIKRLAALVKGEPIAVYASTEMMMPAFLPGTAPIATPDQIILVLGDFRGDVDLPGRFSDRLKPERMAVEGPGTGAAQGGCEQRVIASL